MSVNRAPPPPPPPSPRLDPWTPFPTACPTFEPQQAGFVLAGPDKAYAGEPLEVPVVFAMGGAQPWVRRNVSIRISLTAEDGSELDDLDEQYLSGNQRVFLVEDDCRHIDARPNAGQRNRTTAYFVSCNLKALVPSRYKFAVQMYNRTNYPFEWCEDIILGPRYLADNVLEVRNLSEPFFECPRPTINQAFVVSDLQHLRLLPSYMYRDNRLASPDSESEPEADFALAA